MKKHTIVLIAILFTCFKYNAQKITIITVDENDKPVAGAIILFDDVKQKRWTNSSGVLKASFDTQPKIISAFHPKIGITKVNFKGGKKIKIIIKKGNDTHIFENASKKIISSQFNTIYDYIRGKVAGVNVSSDNIIRIRGYNSLNGNMTPLFILNGTEISKDVFSQIMPDEINAVSILKGSESAVYGARAANGVILVNTYQ